MSENKLHNLDEGVEESFNFQILGHVYKFQQLTTEELEKFQSLTKKAKNDDEKDLEEMKQYLFQFVSKVNKDTPEFSEIVKKMLVPHWNKFIEMVKTEFGG